MIEIYVKLPEYLGWLISASLLITCISSTLSIYDSYLKFKIDRLKALEQSNE